MPVDANSEAPGATIGSEDREKECMHPNRAFATAGIALTALLTLSACAAESDPPAPSSTTATEAPTPAPDPIETEPPAETEAPAETPSPAETESQESGSEAVNGSWCDVDGSTCFEVELPDVTYEDGSTYDITAHDSPWDHGNGVYEYAMIDAPLGTYYPAGVPLEGYDDSKGPDPIDEDRIWNSQNGLLAVRQ